MLTPATGLPETARFRGPRLALQGFLLRFLRPYWWQQRQLQSLTLEAVRTVSETRAADAASRHADVLQRLAEIESTLGRQVADALASQQEETRQSSRAFETVKMEAEAQGVSPTWSEIVGLVPERALFETAARHIRLREFKPEMVLEHKVRAAVQGGESLSGFVSNVASPSPTPGGGSVAAHAGALGAALAQMVAGLTAGKKKYASVDAEMRELALEEVRTNCVQTVVTFETRIASEIVEAFEPCSWTVDHGGRDRVVECHHGIVGHALQKTV